MEPSIVYLRTADEILEREVQRLCALAGVELRVLPPGGEPPAGVVVLDDAGDPGGDHDPMPEETRIAVAARPADGAFVLPADAEALLDELSALQSPGPGRIVGVLGARGGCGATALAAALARVSHETGLSTALVDLDPGGGGTELLLGIEHDPGPRWADLLDQRGAFAAQRLRDALPRWRGVRVLGGDVRGGVDATHPTARLAVVALARSCAVVVVDLPRSTLVAGGTQPLLGADGELVLLAGTDIRSIAAAQAATGMLADAGVTPRLVVRTARGPSLDATVVGEATALPVLTTVRSERGFDAAVAHGACPVGQPRGPLAAAARRIAQGLGVGR